MDLKAMMATFNVTDFIGELLKMISVLLGKDRKVSESNYFEKFANFFLGN